MMPNEGETNSGYPPAVKVVLSKFSSGKEEDKLAGYIKLLKIGPQLLQFVAGDKTKDLRTWLEAYRCKCVEVELQKILKHDRMNLSQNEIFYWRM